MNSAPSLQTAIALHQQGRFAEAEQIYAGILDTEPTNATALRLLGLIRARQGRPDEALALIDRALVHDPASAAARLNRGNVLRAMGRLEEALASYDGAIAQVPDFIDALSNRGVVLCQLDRPHQALKDFDAVLARQPGAGFVLNNRGLALKALGRTAEALADFSHAAARDPRDAMARYNHGLTLEGLKRFGEALVSYEAALHLRPDYLEAWLGRGNALGGLHRFEEAVASYDRALALKPDFAEVHYNRANALCEMGSRKLAADAYTKAIALKPDYTDAVHNRANVLLDLGRFAEAKAGFERVLALKPDHPRALGGLAKSLLHLCDWQALAALEKEVERQAAAIPPFTLLGLGAPGALQLACARAAIATRVPVSPPPLFTARPGKRERIKLAYLSQDFTDHPVAFQMAELFERHDRERFEVLGISTGPDNGSAMRQRLLAGFDRFEDVRGKDDRAVAQMLHRAGVDILVDLGGHTSGSRLEILAHRPAPVQATYFGYAGTTGAAFVDYVIGDAVITPFAHQEFFAEKIVHLPGSFFASNSTRVAGPLPTRQEAGLPQDGFVFCAFNKSWKIRGQIFAIWMRLLKAVPASVLWLRCEEEETRVQLHSAAAAAGVDPKRLVFAPRVSAQAHFARHALADLFLDTLPYNAHATASDALSAGLPVLTCRGDSFPGLVGASMLQAAGLPELVTDTLEDYEALALALARDPARLAGLKRKLAEARETLPLFNTARLCRNLEAAYEAMWARALAGEAPASFAVETDR